MYNRNHVDLIGNVGSVDIRTGQSDVAVLSIATNHRYRDKDGNRQQTTQWHRVVAFRPSLVKLVEAHIAKGDLINVQGFLRTEKWTDAEGRDRYSTEIIANSFGFLSSKRDAEDSGDDDQD